MRQEALVKRPTTGQTAENTAIAKRIHTAADRAREEARARQAEQNARPRLAMEIGGPASPEPTRYGDWERKGIASDF